MAAITRNGMFPPELVSEMFNMVQGHSSLAKMAGSRPIGFNGTGIFTFALDDEVDLVAEGGAKSEGTAGIGLAQIQPVKIEYGFRTSDEFMIASEEYQLDVLRAFAEGFARKTARGLDIMAFAGVNPRTDTAATALASYNFAGNCSTSDTYVPATPDPVGNIQAVIAAIEANGYESTGMILGPTLRSALAAVTEGSGSNKPLFPELMFGGKPDTFYGLDFDVNSTVEYSSTVDLRAVIGNFRDYFKWGYAKQIPIKVIEYGDPDNSGKDLQGYNQVYIRGEAYIGWGILDYNAFGFIDE